MVLRNVPSLFALLLCACSSAPSTGDAPDASLRLRPLGPKALIPSEFVLVLASGSQVGRLACPGGKPTVLGAHCTGTLAAVDTPQAPLDLLLKARGLHTLQRTLSAAEVQNARVAHGLDLNLAALPAPVQNADYATQLPAGQGTAAFDALAYPAQTELGQTFAVKFYVRKLDTKQPEIFFQNTKKHFLHYAFAHGVLGEPGTATQFAQKTYSGADRTQMAGTLVRYPTVAAATAADGAPLQAPVCLTFFPSDDLTPAMAARIHTLLEERLGFVALTGTQDRLVYLPAGSKQETQAAAAAADLARADVPWLAHTALYGGLKLQVLNPGLSYGTLRRMTPEDLASAVVSFTDILLLTRLPNELPIVGGTIVEELQTPLAHVNVAAHTRGLPNVSLLGATEDPRVAPYIGKLVRFEAKNGAFTLQETTLEEAKAFWDKGKKPAFVPVFDDDYTGLPDFAALHFADFNRVGVKAANVAELSHLLGKQAPTGFAVPFHDYRAFMTTSVVTPALCQLAHADCLGGGRDAKLCDNALTFCGLPGAASETLAQYADRLIDDTALAADAPALEAVLAGLVSHMRNAPVNPTFAQQLNAAIQVRFGQGKVRLRSSTNSEDLPGFSGAGMYTSVGAKGSGSNLASDKIREVWASVWSWRAFEERAYWNIDHRAVRMGVLVHQSFPDEAANGVLITQNIADMNTVGMYVNVQLGEISVTNPTDGAVAEIFAIVPAPGGLQVQRLRFSSLSPEQALLTDAEVKALYEAAALVQKHFAPLYQQDAETLALDIEFKFEGADRALFLKQVRPYVASPSP